MRAVTVREFGGPEALEIVERETPVPGAGEVLIRVAAAAVNPADIMARTGGFGPLPSGLDRLVLGWDVAGTVARLGEGVTGYAEGDPVIAMSDWYDRRTGTQAEFVVLPADTLAPAPGTVSLEEAGTLPLNGLTAYQALDLLALPAGATLAVTGAAGAVGGYTVELAARRGLRVLAIAGAQDEEQVRAWGAEWFVPRADDPAAAVRAVLPDGVDALFDTVVIGTAALGAVRDGGTYVHVWPRVELPGERGITVRGVSVRANGAQLTELAGLVERGELSVRVAGTYPLAEVAAAQQRLAKGGVRGRLVLVP